MERYRLQNGVEIIPPAKPKKTIGNPFQPGKAGPRKGRPPGSENRLSSNLRHAIVLAAEVVGDGKGKGGLLAYLKTIAKKDHKTYAQMLMKVIPAQVTGPGGGPIPFVNIADTVLRAATPEELEVLQNLLERAKDGRSTPMIEDQSEDGNEYERMLSEDSEVDGHG